MSGKPKSNTGASTKRTNSPSRNSGSQSRASTAAPRKEQALQHYQICQTIGEGTFGKVKKGIHKLTGQPVAIKVLEKSRILEAADVERVRREIYILRKIDHTNVIKLYEVIDSPACIFLIMEFCPGGELFEYIVARGRVEELDACRCFHHILNGLDYCHKQNVTHRDLKPENLLLTSDSTIKIVDFGLSNIAPSGALMKTACGSPCYAAPEMIAGLEYHGPVADMWSLGVILFALSCGYLPFEDANTVKLYEKIVNCDYQLPDFISEGIRDLIRRLLNTNPRERFDAAAVRRHPWYCQVSVSSDPPSASHSYRHSQAHLSVDEPVHVDEELIDELVSRMGFNAAAVRQSVTNKTHDHLSATYELLRLHHRTKQQRAATTASKTVTASTTTTSTSGTTTASPARSTTSSTTTRAASSRKKSDRAPSSASTNTTGSGNSAVPVASVDESKGSHPASPLSVAASTHSDEWSPRPVEPRSIHVASGAATHRPTSSYPPPAPAPAYSSMWEQKHDAPSSSSASATERDRLRFQPPAQYPAKYGHASTKAPPSTLTAPAAPNQQSTAGHNVTIVGVPTYSNDQRFANSRPVTARVSAHSDTQPRGGSETQRNGNERRERERDDTTQQNQHHNYTSSSSNNGNSNNANKRHLGPEDESKERSGATSARVSASEGTQSNARSSHSEGSTQVSKPPRLLPLSQPLNLQPQQPLSIVGRPQSPLPSPARSTTGPAPFPVAPMPAPPKTGVPSAYRRSVRTARRSQAAGDSAVASSTGAQQQQQTSDGNGTSVANTVRGNGPAVVIPPLQLSLAHAVAAAESEGSTSPPAAQQPTSFAPRPPAYSGAARSAHRGSRAHRRNVGTVADIEVVSNHTATSAASSNGPFAFSPQPPHRAISHIPQSSSSYHDALSETSPAMGAHRAWTARASTSVTRDSVDGGRQHDSAYHAKRAAEALAGSMSARPSVSASTSPRHHRGADSNGYYPSERKSASSQYYSSGTNQSHGHTSVMTSRPATGYSVAQQPTRSGAAKERAIFLSAQKAALALA